MFIIYSIIIGVALFVITYAATRAICKSKVTRKNIAFANLPRKVLLTHARMSPVYMLEYEKMLACGTSEDRAMTLVTDRMLIDYGLIGYRKVES